MSGNNLILIGTYHVDIDGPVRLEKILRKIKPEIIAVEMTEKRAVPFEENARIVDIEEHISERKRTADILEKYYEQDKEDFKQKQEEVYSLFETYLTPKQIATLETVATVIGLTGVSHGYELIVPKKYVLENPSVLLEYIDLPEKEDIDEIGNTLTNAVNEGVPSYIHNEKDFKESFLHGLSEGIDFFVKDCREKIAYRYNNFLEEAQGFEDIRKTVAELDDAFSRTVFNSERDEYMASAVRRLRLHHPSKSILTIVGIGHFLPLKTALADLEPKAITLDQYVSI